MRARGLAGVAVFATMALAAPAGAADAPGADEEKVCAPACHPGEICFQGVCMVPAPPAGQAASPPPPNGYPPPPYGYPPPPYGYPPAPHGYAPPPPRSPRTGLLAILYTGVVAISDNSSTDTGLRLGAILGGRVNETFSINGEVSGDVVDVDAPAGVSASEYMGTVAFSPLFHLTTPSVDLVAGPKLGLWYLTAHLSDSYQSVDITERGWTLGLNLGVFFPVNDTTSLGMLFSLATAEPTKACVSGSSYPERCITDGFTNGQILGLTFAALF